MSREILFRGKNVDNGAWVEGYYEELTAYYDGTTTPKIVTPTKDTDDYNCWSFVLPDTVGQYTGLRDRNGKKIFEGDIVRVYLENSAPFPTLYVVKIGKYLDVDPGDYALGVYLDNGKEQVNILSGEENTYFEIVGNIYDNPELLEVE